MSEFVEIFEMAPRDGLQNEARLIPTAEKIALIDRLSACGFRKIEVTSFVSPKWVPQMADAAEVLAGIKRRKGVSYTALTPNLRGYAAAREAQVDEVAIFMSASEGFSQKNINCSVEESYARFEPILEAATKDGMPVRGYISCVTDCPYDGPTPPASVADAAKRLMEMGCYGVSLGDTIGKATPKTTRAMLDAVLEVVRAPDLAGHFHDTDGQALANIEVALELGLRIFDASTGGLGGCPYAPGAKGNVDTMAVAARLKDLGYQTGLSFAPLLDAAGFARSLRDAA
ncbi:hydroxymethylglutaryl-CoA lyase [Rhodobacteraceae bacterium NNCM2]|nr:hydroxymethylglutaryl-CoA lyase [Coraliihabitans acroporae]